MSAIAYIRVSTDTQDLNNQKLEILDYANRHQMQIDKFLEIKISSHKSSRERRIDELTGLLQTGDTLIISELSRLGRSIVEVIVLVNGLVARGVRIIVIKQKMDLTAGKNDMATKIMVTIFSLLIELERDLISSRTKTGLAAVKAKGKKLGRRKGEIGKSRLDGREGEIRMLLKAKVSKSAISRLTGMSRTAMLNFITSRGLLDN